MNYLIVVACSVSDLKGIGEEWLIDPITLEPRLKFYNGSIINALAQAINAEDDTLEVA